MALTKCKECGHEVSTDAKACPNCGARLKTSFAAKTLAVVGGFILFSYAMQLFYQETEADRQRAASEKHAAQERQKTAQAIVKKERKVVSADWSSPLHFVAAVLPDGTRRDGFAQYLCEAYFSGRGITIDILDATKDTYTSIGRARCK